MDKKEVKKLVETTWLNFCKNNPKDAKYLGSKNPKTAFCTYFKKNSYGYVDNDCSYVVKTLSLIGIRDENIAKEYYYSEIFGNYPQTATKKV